MEKNKKQTEQHIKPAQDGVLVWPGLLVRAILSVSAPNHFKVRKPDWPF